MLTDKIMFSKMVEQSTYWLDDEGDIRKYACLAHKYNLEKAKYNEPFKFHYRVESLPLGTASAYLEFVNEHIYPIKFDDSIIEMQPIIIDGQYSYKNTLVVFTILRQLWEAGGNRETNFNQPFIKKILSDEVTDFSSYLKTYQEMYNKAVTKPHGGHSLLWKGYGSEGTAKFTRLDVVSNDLLTYRFTSVHDFTQYITR